MEHLHIFNNTNMKFSEPYIDFINSNFSIDKHAFILVGKKKINIPTRKNVNQVSIIFTDIALLIVKLYKTDKVFLHGLFSPIIIILLFFQPWLLKKCNWIVWGGDLYSYLEEKKTLKARVVEFLKRFVLKNIGGLITHLKGDYDLARTWYRVRGKHYYSFMYPSNLYKDYDLPGNNKSGEKVYIQIGNSADPSNNHIEIFEKLLLFNNYNFVVICPLSYGDPNYANKVIKKGKELLSEKFIPLTEFMSINNYLEVLANIDVAIFNHTRQQAVGNITSLLSLGKKVYIRDDITTWGFCMDHELKVFSLNSEFHNIFKPIPVEIKNKNKIKMKEQFSEEKLVSDWEKIFEGN